MKKALVVSIIGHDVFSLIELLLEKGYEVHGIKSHASLLKDFVVNTSYSGEYINSTNFLLHYIDITDAPAITRLMREVQPDEIYILGTLSRAHLPFETPEYNNEISALNTLRILEAVCDAGLKSTTRIYQTTNPTTTVRSKYWSSTFHSPSFTTTRLNSHEIMIRYRGAHGIHASTGVLFGYDLLRRGETHLLHKITQGAVRIVCGLQGTLYLTSLSARLDWGHARDYAEAMWRILQQPIPEDFIIATGLVTTVREVVRLVFSELGIDIVFQGEGAREVGYVIACHNLDFTLMPGQTVIAIDPIYYRAQAVEPPLAEASKARRQLAWKPSHNIRTLIREMIAHDVQLFQRNTTLTKADNHVLFSLS